MCGIAGMLRHDGAPVEGALIEQMIRVLRHRGPDSSGIHVDGSLGLGAARLAIIDLEHGDQPIRDPAAGLCVVQNGEVYNHRELREELSRRGLRFDTHSDTEVILRAYQAEGPRFVRRLRGMFALAIWDAPRRRLVLARDRFGIKPLLYRRTASSLAFASELKSLLCLPDFSGEVDPAAVHAFLSHNSIPAPLTIYRDARKLAPGHMLVSVDGRIHIERFARPAPASAAGLRRESEEELAEELRERLRDSVRAHLVSDVPVGVLLSGGVDSSTITALAAQEGSRAPSTFSIGFAERSFNELDSARLVARRYETDHHEVVLLPEDAQRMVEIGAAFDEPFADSSALATYLVAELAAAHVKVVLTGEGADELFGGYETYVADLLAMRRLPGLALAGPLVRRLPSSNGRVSVEYRAKRFIEARSLPPLERHHGFKEIFTRAQRAALLREAWRGEHDPLATGRARFAETVGAPLLARLQDVDIGVYLVDDLLVKTDRMTMAHSLEARVPFLDQVVAELAGALPTSMKVRGWSKKRLLRRAVEPWVPAAILRGRKRGFSIPAAAWLRGQLEPFAREILAADVLRAQGFFEPAAIEAVLDAHMRGQRDNSRQLWGLMCFTLWADGARGAGGAPRGDPTPSWSRWRGAGLDPERGSAAAR